MVAFFIFAPLKNIVLSSLPRAIHYEDEKQMRSKEQLITGISKVINMQPKKLSDEEIETLIFIREKIRNTDDMDKILEYVQYLIKVTGMDLHDL